LSDKFLIIDGSSLVHRAFYALPILTNREGVFTNAVYGFTNMLLKIIEQEQPKYLAVAFDKGRVTFRNIAFREYKGHRKATSPELKPQFSLVQKVLQALNVSFFELENYEADDIIGTFVRLGEKDGLTNVIITGDKDLLQLITEKSRVLLTRKGISQTEYIDLPKLREIYELEPRQMIDVKGLMGDQSDNIPGVPSVGEKTALKLIKQFGSVEGVYENIDQVKGEKLRYNLQENKEKAFLSKELATIECCVPMELDIKKCIYEKPNYKQLLTLFKDLEFNSLVKRFLEEMEPDTNENLTEKLLAEKFLNGYNKSKPVALYMEFKGTKNTPQFVSAVMVQAGLATSFESSQEEVFNDFFKDNPQVNVIVHDFKEVYKYFKYKGISIKNVQDSQIGAYLLNPVRSNYGIEELALEYLNKALAEGSDAVFNAIEKAAILEELFLNIQEQLKESNLYELYMNIEMPLIAILAEMELTGVKVEKNVLEIMGENLEKKLNKLTKDIYELAGEEFNINSPKQLGSILFEKMDLPNGKKTKTGYSTNAEVLEHITHPIGEKLLEYRQLTKLKGTYIDGLKEIINDETGKIHTTFKQTITATGRLSSVEPNLQNIPIRLEEGRVLRKAFVPSEKDNVLIAADYSQIELRILAHLSEDENLLDAFEKGHDIHTRTASEVFGVPMENVTSQMRRNAKAVNFGIVYGISDFGLSRDLGISIKEAKMYIEQYFKRYQGVNTYISDIIAKARDNGYVTTLLNRRRYLPDLFSPNKMVRSFGERTAMNTPIQGSAADIIKIAMIKCQEFLEKEDLPVKMLLQVHDELIFECPEKLYEEVASSLVSCMENALELKVPLIVDVKYGFNWYDLKSI